MITFTIPGDPVPYLRMTQGQTRLMRIPDRKTSRQGAAVKARIRRYLVFKEFVLLCSLGKKYNPAPMSKTILNVTVFFKNRKHGDPDNIRKGIQDALFTQDRCIAGSVDYFYDPQRPRCEVEILEIAN